MASPYLWRLSKCRYYRVLIDDVLSPRHFNEITAGRNKNAQSNTRRKSRFCIFGYKYMCILVQLISKYWQKQNTPMDWAYWVLFLSFLFLFCVTDIYNPVDLFGALFCCWKSANELCSRSVWIYMLVMDKIRTNSTNYLRSCAKSIRPLATLNFCESKNRERSRHLLKIKIRKVLPISYEWVLSPKFILSSQQWLRLVVIVYPLSKKFPRSQVYVLRSHMNDFNT